MRFSVKPADAPLLDHTCRTRTSRLRARRSPLAPLVIIRGIRSQPAAISTDGSQLSRIRTENRGEVNLDAAGAAPRSSRSQIRAPSRPATLPRLSEVARGSSGRIVSPCVQTLERTSSRSGLEPGPYAEQKEDRRSVVTGNSGAEGV